MAAELNEETAAAPSGAGRLVTVMSPKGGVGRTAVTVNVAAALNDWSEPDRVVVVDADLQFGDVSLALQLDPAASFADAAVLAAPEEPSLRRLLTRHDTGLWVLPAPPDPISADDIDVEGVVRVLRLLWRMFAYAVVDTGAFLGEPMLTIMEESEVVLVVVDADLQTIKNVKLSFDAMRRYGFPMEKLRLVVNRADTRSKLDLEELHRPLGIPASARIPYDPEVLVAVNRGEPIVLSRPKSKVAEGFRQVAKLVARPADVRSALRG